MCNIRARLYRSRGSIDGSGAPATLFAGLGSFGFLDLPFAPIPPEAVPGVSGWAFYGMVGLRRAR